MGDALIVWDGWSGHAPEQCAAIVAAMLEDEEFNVSLDTSTRAFADPRLADLSLIMPIYTMSKIEKDEVANLSRAVRGGVGLAGFHGGMGDAFRDAVEYQFMCGGQWVAHPGNIIDYRVNVARPDDLIMQRIEDFDYRSEQYYLHVDPSNEVLATTTISGEHASWIEDVVMPVVWKRRHGRGRGLLQLPRPRVEGVRRAADADHPAARHGLGSLEGFLTGRQTLGRRRATPPLAFLGRLDHP